MFLISAAIHHGMTPRKDIPETDVGQRSAFGSFLLLMVKTLS